LCHCFPLVCLGLLALHLLRMHTHTDVQLVVRCRVLPSCLPWPACCSRPAYAHIHRCAVSGKVPSASHSCISSMEVKGRRKGMTGSSCFCHHITANDLH
jgi:hypothetical protein